MRILLTGVTGQVGGALHVPLGEFGEVVAVDRTQFDLSRPESIAPALNRIRPDLIVNPAAFTAVDLAEDESELAFRVNAHAPAKMASWASVHDVPFVHFSTDYVFDGSGTRPWREFDTPSPLSVYGISKLAGDEAVREARGSHVILRTSWVYASEGRNFLKTIARLAQERDVLRVVADQFGAPTSARMIADAVVQILRAELSKGPDAFRREHGIFNLAAADETSWHGFASFIVAGLRARGSNVVTEKVTAIVSAEFPTKARRPRNSRLDCGRLQDVYGIKMPTWRMGLDTELNVMTGRARGAT